jgi:hypothetical protein
MELNKEIKKPSPTILFKYWEIFLALHQIYGFLGDY